MRALFDGEKPKYNFAMRLKNAPIGILILAIAACVLLPWITAKAGPVASSQARPKHVSAYELILAMNTLRVSNGLPALIEDPIVNAVAQTTAEIMAANQMTWHIGDVRGRIQAAGYGGGATVWATENFAVGQSMGIDQIMLAWADPDHMRPAVNPAYCHVGAGVAKASNGRTYYVLQAAYVSGAACGEYTSTGGAGTTTTFNPVPQIIVPVAVATPDQEGKIYHEVKMGQSFWSIAIAYQTTIKDLEFWNNLSRDVDLQVGQILFIPSISTQGYATPTPVGLVVPNPPDEQGRIIHDVEAYHNLTTISTAYRVSVDRIVSLNGIQVDTPLQIGQKLLISPGNITPTATPGPLERLTPDSEGNYYHIVSSGETLSGIARNYEISLNELLTWNNLNTASIIRPGDNLRLEVPTATPAPTAVPPTSAPTATSPPPTENNSRPTGTPALITTPVPERASSEDNTSLQPWMLGGAISLLGLGLFLFIFVRKRI